MGCVREYVSMGSSSEQLQSEVKALSRQEREKLLDSAMSSSPIAIPSGEVLSMKADLSITWSKLRILRRYMYTF